MKHFYLVGAIIGLAVGLASALWLNSLQWGNIAIWGVIGVLVGVICKDRKSAMWSGMIFGFFLSLAFLFGGFRGELSRLPAFSAFTLALSLLSALGGLLASVVGYWIRERVQKIAHR